MVSVTEEIIKQLQTHLQKIDERLKNSYRNIHNGYEKESLTRFLKARDGNVSDALKMLIDCLNWRIQNEIDDILMKPIKFDVFMAIRGSHLVGISGYSKQGLPVIAIGVGMSTYDKASIHYYVQSHIQLNEYRDRVILPAATEKYGRYIGTCIKILDMTGLRISALSQIKLLTVISTIDDLNYPEKTETYYIVNAPYIFSACWKVVKPLLQERTRKKIQVLSGVGRDDLLKVMDYQSLPHFCQGENTGSASDSSNGTVGNCFSFKHPFHRQLYDHITEQATLMKTDALIKHGSVHVDFPEPDLKDVKIVQTIEKEIQRIGNENRPCLLLQDLEINGDQK